ncbi:hypothetical protein SAMN02745911_1205 [Aureimonas altamirensis DSM 21988]|uniref:Mlr8007 protein n=2 Tax=Aureimonas altamirensis TaxID=370622 RepID=A0A0P0YX11_9HYPH|nr:DUF2190 family protein [Aureimonas altamirensis]BAT26060.1 Mlr8007 protein [Aureimonas altamirensis]SHI79965.1 hypothetical protein SAMN02745911_1205 [Aureimonas altamirensis DSM 21988]
MDPLQTTYADRQARWIEGMIPDMRTPGQDISMNVETAAGIGFGKVAVQGAQDNQIRVSAASRAFRGITVLDTTQLQDSYPQYATARVRTKGPVVVTAAVAVAAGALAYYVPATGALTNVATDNTLIGKWETTTTGANQLAVLTLS